MASDLVFESGAELLSAWESSPGIRRYFAQCCGSPIYKADAASPEVYGFRLGTLDTDPGQRVTQHYMVESVAPWVALVDDLDRVPGGDAPFGQGD